MNMGLEDHFYYKIYFNFLKMCPIFVCSVHNFDKSNDDMI